MLQQELGNTVFCFFGAPGSGKGTLAKRCQKELGFNVLSTGDMCRKHIADKTEIGIQVEKIINSGHLIPDDLITKMVKEWLDSNLKLNKPIILDGYPRTSDQLELFKELHTKEGYTFKFRVILFDVTDEQVIKRLVNRRVCSNKDCQAIFSLISLPPKQDGVCDYCGSQLVTRDDDREDVIKERFMHFNLHKEEFLRFCKSVDQPVEFLNVDNKPIDEIFENFKQTL